MHCHRGEDCKCQDIFYLQELVIFLLYVSTAHFEKYLSKTNLGC
jgi:hypothetical protein